MLKILLYRALCDTAEQGKLNNEQFALALWLISRKLKGIDPPSQLTPDMIPPSCRKPAEAPANVSESLLQKKKFLILLHFLKIRRKKFIQVTFTGFR